MERESFEIQATADVMNEHFINIKVDREERPDVDEIYMTAVQALTGRGGWPMSVFLEPETLKPFFGGTYFPPTDQGNRPGFISVLTQIADHWKNDRPRVDRTANAVALDVQKRLSLQQAPAETGPEHIEQAVTAYLSRYDRTHAGFSGERGPKFPMPVTLDFLIEHGWDRPEVRDAVTHTLDRMATGGMYDQVGGGFHRYSTDQKWLVPHFEKMLYDNGQLASIYAAAYARTGDAFYGEIARETLDYVLAEMTDDATGAFYSAQDAEVNHHEGENYLWTAAAVTETLTAAGLGDDVDQAIVAYGLDRGTNFRDPHAPDEPPSNVLYLPIHPREMARTESVEPEDLHAFFTRVNQAMYDVRATRDQPGLDDKVITAWNGLMISGFADGGRLLEDEAYTDAAARAATYIMTTMRSDDGGLLRTSLGEQMGGQGFLEDYAMMIRGLLALHRATGDPKAIAWAMELTDQAQRRFWDTDRGGYFDTQEGQSDLFVRARSFYDGVIPTGNAQMVRNLVALHEATKDAAYLDAAHATIGSISGMIARSPTTAVTATHGLGTILRDHTVAVTPVAPSTPPPLAVGGLSNKTVAVAVSERVVRLGEGGSATVDVMLTIRAGYHMTAPDPGSEFAVPLEILAIGQGFTVTPAWPQSHPYTGPEGSVNVYSGTVTIPVTITRTGAISSRHKVMARFQVCNDQVCLMPEEVLLPVKVLSERP
jgi:hypothetical protein